MKCGKPVEKQEEFCRECREKPRMFTQGKGIFLYDEQWKLSLEKYKYYGCREYGDFFAQAMYLFSKKELAMWKPNLLVPVPLYRKKQRMRGFNQSLYLAERLSEKTGIPVDGELVYKKRATKSQKKLDASERRSNLKGAFGVKKRVDGKKILVIDDVYTTGSTMEEMAFCLRQNGAEKVYFLTVCTGFR